MQLPLEADGQRVVDDLLQVKLVMRNVLGDRFAEQEIAGHPEEVWLAFDGTPIFSFGDVAYIRHHDGSVSESRAVERHHIAYRLFNQTGKTLRFDLTRRRSGPDLAEILLERAAQHGEPSLN